MAEFENTSGMSKHREHGWPSTAGLNNRHYLQPVTRLSSSLNGRRLSSNRPRPCPSSSENILGWAQSSLTSAGIAQESDEEVLSVSPPAQEDFEGDLYPDWSNAVQAILSLPQTTTQALLDLVSSDVLCMYPCVDISTIEQNLMTVYRNLQSHDNRTYLSLVDTEIVKACLLVGACAQQSDEDGLVALLETSICWSVETIFSQDSVNLEDLTMTCLLSTSHHQRDQRQKAWRMAGCGARIALELSMDLDPSDQPDEVAESTYLDKQRKLLFCCISYLDTRSSLLVGLPRILEHQVRPQHLDALDPTCHLRAMHEMDRIADEILVLVKEARVVGEISSDKLDYLDFRLSSIQNINAAETSSICEPIIYASLFDEGA
ncbi:hypothetical protein Slin14017_G069170 [Septoria linicola]|nr:hypothetical protein Slin14017_G069170 [Septoria linicola]